MEKGVWCLISSPCTATCTRSAASCKESFLKAPSSPGTSENLEEHGGYGGSSMDNIWKETSPTATASWSDTCRW